MKISIITPTYNSEKTIDRTIQSVLSQNYNDIEHIIIDGSSVDGTMCIVNKYAGKLSKIISEKDDGIFDAMNKGISIASGDIIGILNSDDFFNSNDVLSIIANEFNDSSVDAVYGDISYFLNDTNKITRYWKAGEYKEKKLNNGWIIPHPALFLRRSVYSKLGVFNLDLKVAADYEFILRIIKTKKVKLKYVKKILVRMYGGGNSGKSLKKRMEGWKDMKKSWLLNGYKTPPLFILRRLVSRFSQFV